MKRRGRLKGLFYLNVLIVIALVGYKTYLNFFKPDINAAHTEQLIEMETQLQDQDSISFAVVGNINNSIGIFERKIIPILNSSDVDFMVSAGNAVSGASEDKYRSLHGTLNRLRKPYLLTFGENEADNFGSIRFYEHFGPHYYSVSVAGSRLIFLDSTGKTSERWQLHWLGNLLSQNDAAHTFLFIGHPLLPIEQETLFNLDDDYLAKESFRKQLIELIDSHEVDAVFSANRPVFSRQQRDGTVYITTGGAGGLVLNNEDSFYHYVKVTASPDGVAIDTVPLEINQHPVFRHLESLWFVIYSFFFAGLLDFILVVSLLGIVAIRLYMLIFVERDYYPDYDADPTPWLNQSLRVAMFTNNYLPFVGGVPISIQRLRRGLAALGDQVMIIAPRYGGEPAEDDRTLRVPSLQLPTGNREFRLPNMLWPPIRRRVRAFKPDIIHLHHPIGLGSTGLFLARRLRVPAVYTYHTRLEHYAHFVPLPGRLFRNLISHALIKRFTNKCDGVIVPTDAAEEYLRLIGVKSAIYVQPTGIEYDRFQRVSDEALSELRNRLGLNNECVIISVSRLSDEKNIDFMIDAIASLREHTSIPFRFLLIGDGHQRGRYQQRIDDLGLADCFTLVGKVPPEQMPVYYRLGNLFAFASKSESQGMVILEAMAAGLPVVAVRSSGIDDVIRHGDDGFKTPENREKWRDAIAELMTNENLRTTLGSNALRNAQAHSIEQFARNVKSIYAEVLAATRAG